jgi:predicted metalloprotease with PDZ domain
MEFIAHEFFHLYNIKTIRPIALGPFDYDRENYTNMLWVSEGFTVYYDYHKGPGRK